MTEVLETENFILKVKGGHLGKLKKKFSVEKDAWVSVTKRQN
jgi:hypothetical protein